PFRSTGAFTYPHTYTGDTAGTCTSHNNTATFTTNTTSTTGSASATVKVCVGADLTVTKTAAPTFTRTFTWGIAKDVDKTSVKIASGGSATFNYTVNVTHDAGSDSAWAVNGTITVTNPNDWEAITANLTDGVDNLGLCTVTGGPTVTVPPSTAAILNYSCAYAVAPNPLSGTNTATATRDTATFKTNTTSATGSAGKSVTVCVGADLTVSKTAVSTFTRTYGWTISKNVDKTLVKLLNGSATFNYTVSASQTGFTDSAWLATG